MRNLLHPIAYLTVVMMVAGPTPTPAGPRLEAPPSSAVPIDWNRILRLPREEAIALAYAPEYDDFETGILSLVFRAWAMDDPPAAHARLMTLANDFDVALIEIQILEAWARIDPTAAVDAANRSGAPNALGMTLGALARHNPSEALDAMDRHDFAVAPADRETVLSTVAGTNPYRAAEYVAALGIGGSPWIGSVIHELARRDPPFALDWLRRHFPDDTRYHEAIASVFFIADPAEAFDYLRAMPPGPSRTFLEAGLCRARHINETSRAESRLPQPPVDYARGFCSTH